MILKVALLQLMPETGQDGQLQKGLSACRKAKELGADIVLFPEMWNDGYSLPQDAELLNELAISAGSSFVQSFKNLAKELQIAIGITFLEQHKPKPLNTMILFDMKGEERLPLVFIAAYASQIAYVWFNEDEHIISYRGRVIAAWLYPDSEVYKDTNYFPLQLREMVKSGGILGNKAAFLTDSISYRDGSGLLLVGLFQRFGFLGFAAISALTAVLCRQIWRIASTQLRKGNTYQATVCRGICIFFALSGVWSVISYLYILPMTSMFDYPFLCVNGFLPVWFLCLAAALSTTDTYSQPFKKDQMN